MKPVMTSPLLLSNDWQDYELLASGEGMKQERWGDKILIRPEVAATWPQEDKVSWKKWDGIFRTTSDNNHGSWEWRNGSPEAWTLSYRHLKFLIRPTTSKQVGLFPEQAQNWNWLSERISLAKRPIKLLNLFGYTGAASIAAASAGASVCHIDSSKAMVAWCAENAKNSGLCKEGEKPPLRLIAEDCQKFITREIRRKNSYDAIILDPPAFGRGSSGELWKLEEQLPELLDSCQQLLSNNPLFLLISTYSPTFTPERLGMTLNNILRTPAEVFSLGLQGSNDKKIISCGLTARITF